MITDSSKFLDPLSNSPGGPSAGLFRAARSKSRQRTKLRPTEGLRGEESIAELRRREGIATSLYYSWSNEFLDAGNRRSSDDRARQALEMEVFP